jgi:UDP-N-acetylglucosamine transferase subunit ALG13
LSTFVTVGNATQPFDRLLDAIALSTEVLPKPVVVQRGVSRVCHPQWETHDFLNMETFEQFVSGCTLLIMHAGAGSVIHALTAGRRPVVMPRRARWGEIVDDHQLEFAEALQGTGQVIVAHDAEELPRAIALALQADVPTRDETKTLLIAHVDQLLQSWARGL